MKRRPLLGVMLTLLLISTSALVFNIHSAIASFPVHNIDTGLDYERIQYAIDATETLDGHTILVDAGTYHEIVTVSKSLRLIGENESTTIIDASTTPPGGVVNIDADDVTFNKFTVQNGGTWIFGVIARFCSNVNISKSIIKNCGYGIVLSHCNESIVSQNIVIDSLSPDEGIYAEFSHQNTFWGNYVNGSSTCIHITLSTYNTVRHNTVCDGSDYGIYIHGSGYNIVHHNKFINNRHQAMTSTSAYNNTWDNGYPSGGNYWSDQDHGPSADHYNGPYQNETGSDGIVDTPYTINANNKDRYPLMTPYIDTHDVAIADVETSETMVILGVSVQINVTAENLGSFFETFNVTAYANTTTIGTQTLTDITPGASVNIPFTWDTAAANLGSYIVSAQATTVPNETSTTDNVFTDGTVWVFPSIHDIAISNVESSHNFAYVGDTAQIHVDASNLGTYQETLNVTVYADRIIWPLGDEIAVGNVISLIPARSSITLTIPWDTTSITPGNYTLSAFAIPVPGEEDISNNICVDGKVEISAITPCPDVNIVSPGIVQLNPSIFSFNTTLEALQLPMGNMFITSTGFEGNLRVVGSKNNTIQLCINQPGTEEYTYYLPEYDTIQVPLWLVFEPGTYSGTYELNLTVCGTYRSKITVNIIDLWVCGNGAYNTAGGTASFSWSLACPPWAYLKAETALPLGWSFSVDPPLETLFETPHMINLNITASPDAEEGDIGIVTLMAFDNETDTMFWHFTYFSSIDPTPPVIEEVQVPTHTFEGGLLFNTTVKDPGSGIQSVQLLYQVNDGPWNNETMSWQEGDTFNTTVYTLQTPPVPNGCTVKYYVVATDWLKNQTQSETQTIIVTSDVATTNIKTQKTVICQGYDTDIQVTVQNQGTITENDLKVALYADTTLIQARTISSLINGTSTTLTFNWNTTGFPKGNYTINAFAVPVTYEAETIDNLLTDGWLRITMLGDITKPYGEVDVYDKVIVGATFGATYNATDGMYWHQPPDFTGPCPYCPHNPNADINGDLTVDVFDKVIVGVHFGETEP